jgi:hypothetical protein
MTTRIEEGTHAGDEYSLSTIDPIVLDTTPLVFVRSAISTIDAGAGLSLAGETLNVNVDNTTIEINADALRLKDNGVTAAKINSTAVSDGLTGGSGAALQVLPDPTGGANLARAVNVSSNGVAIGIDAISIIEGASNRLEVGTVDGGTF